MVCSIGPTPGADRDQDLPIEEGNLTTSEETMDRVVDPVGLLDFSGALIIVGEDGLTVDGVVMVAWIVIEIEIVEAGVRTEEAIDQTDLVTVVSETALVVPQQGQDPSKI